MSLKKKAIIDMFLNVVAATIPVVILQLIVYPMTAKVIGGEEYGLMLTIYSIWIMISNSLGNVLNNIRLLHNNEYIEKKLEGDFTPLFMRWSIVNSIVVCAIIIYYCNGFNFTHIVLGIIVAFLIITKAYTEVGFRLVLNYKGILINNVLQSIGFLIGAYITVVSGIWESIFILGYLFSSLFCIAKTKLLKEANQKTVLFKVVNSDSNKLILATVISSMMTYADKLILYPLMGGHAVSVYYTASILGKMIGMLTGPINSVVLSYISRWKDDRGSILNKILLIGVILCVIGYIATILLGRPVIGMLFPQWMDEVMEYLPITTINVLLLALISIISPFVLKFCDMKWQIVINGIGVTVYFSMALMLWYFFGLKGFCIGVMSGSFVKLICMLFIYYSMQKSRD